MESVKGFLTNRTLVAFVVALVLWSVVRRFL